MAQKIIIFGATSWIGLQLLKDFVARGDTVGALGRNETKLQELKTAYPEQVEIQVADITDLETSNQKLEALIEKMWWVDIFILSSWIGYWSQYERFSFELDKQVIDTNTTWRTNTIIYILHYFEKKWSWHIVWISSVAAIRWMSMSPSYHATKAYEKVYLESMRLFVDKNKLPITITELQPWFIDTPLVSEKAFGIVSVEKATKYMLKAIDKKRHHAYIPPKWAIVGWLMKWLPYSLYKKIISRVV